MIMDRMYIRDMVVNCVIGTKPSERRKKQKVIINVELECDLARAGRSDALADTVNYKQLNDGIRKLASESRYLLIERLAAAVADICLADGKVKAVTVTVEKPGALRRAAGAAVGIRRTR